MQNDTQNKYNNIMLATAAGALHCIAQSEPADHTRIARLASQASEKLLRLVAPTLEYIDPEVADILSPILETVGTTCQEVQCESRVTLLLLAVFCIEELPVQPRQVMNKINALGACLEGFNDYDVILIGKATWEYIVDELKRGGLDITTSEDEQE